MSSRATLGDLASLGDRMEWARNLSGAELLWLLMQKYDTLRNTSLFDELDVLINEAQDRLYPEFDGDKVQITPWGWDTPEGPIIYDQKDYRERDGNSDK